MLVKNNQNSAALKQFEKATYSIEGQLRAYKVSARGIALAKKDISDKLQYMGSKQTERVQKSADEVKDSKKKAVRRMANNYIKQLFFENRV